MRLALLCTKRCWLACAILACLAISEAVHVPADYQKRSKELQKSAYAHDQSDAGHHLDSTTPSTSKSLAWKCPAQAVGLLRKASNLALKFKGLGTIETACAKDTGCYKRCFCTGFKTTVAVLGVVDIDRAHEAWESCIKQAWQMMVKPRVPKEASDAWKSDACSKTPKCG